MIDVSYEKNPELYTDYREGLKLLASINDDDYEYPEEETIFHVFSEIRTDKEIETVKSYLATQNLEHTKMIVWSLYDISDNPYIEPYKDHIDFRLYNAEELAVGTPLVGNTLYTKVQDDGNHWMSSGIMRFLCLYKYGGIYQDMDMILLRDFKAILGQDFAYQWGGSTDFAKEQRWEPDCHGPCAAMLGAVKGSEYIKNCIEVLLNTPIRPHTNCFDEDMMGPVFVKNPNAFTIFPSTFFNTEWLMSKVDKQLSDDIPAGWFANNGIGDKHLFPEAYAWHWHNSSNKNKPVQPGSKFHTLREITNRKLKERGIL